MLVPSGYSRSAMLNVLGLIGFAIFIVCVIAVAAGITWVVVRLSPGKKPAPAPPKT
jgi:hypothetical protein